MKSLRLDYQRIGKRITYINVICNFILALFKFVVGLIVHSTALISDSVNSASDVLGVVIVIVGLHLSSKKSDKDHPYGHERFECVAAIVLSVFINEVNVYKGNEISDEDLNNAVKAVLFNMVKNCSEYLNIEEPEEK